MKELIKFEIFKIYKSKLFYINLIILIILSFLIVEVNYKSNSYSDEFNYINLKTDNIKLSDEINKNNRIFEYIETNNIDNNDKVKNTFDAFITFLMFSNFLVSYYSSKILIGEFENSTIKNLLARHFSRSKIFSAKLLIIILISITYALTIYLSSLIFTSIIYKINIFNLTSIIYTDKVYEISFVLKYTGNFFLTFIQILFLTVLTYNLSLIFVNSFFSYLISICLSIFAPVISTLLFNINFKIIRYTFLPYLDFKFLLNKINLIYFNDMYKIDLSVSKGINVLIIYLIFTSLIAVNIFKKIDIKK